MQVPVSSRPSSPSPVRRPLKEDPHGSSTLSNAHYCGLCDSYPSVRPPMTREAVRLAPQTSQKIRETMFGRLQSVDFDDLKPIPARFFETAIAATQQRASEENTPRLRQRLKDLDQIEGFFRSGNGCEFLGFAGWGPGCAVPLPANAGMSQYHMVLYRKNGQVFAEEIGSSYTIFESARKPAQHAGGCCDHTHDHSDGEDHSPVETLVPITENGIGYDFTLPKTSKDACGWARSIDYFVHETMFVAEADGSRSNSLKEDWRSKFEQDQAILQRFGSTHKFFHYLGENELGSVNSNLPDNTFLKPETVDIYLMLLEWKLQRLYKNGRLSETLNHAFQCIETKVRTKLGLQS